MNKISIPDNWDDLLFYIGKVIKSDNTWSIEIFAEGLNQLQDSIPADFAKQIKPYRKQLENSDYGSYLFEFVQNWTGETKSYSEKKDESWNTFFRNKLVLLHRKMQKGNKLPFLSTPSVEPFYTDPETLISKLEEYEKAKEEPHMEDLIVACNRVSEKKVSAGLKERIKKLKGNYSSALQYLFGIQDRIKAEKDLLPLWTQIARTKDPEGVFKEFEKTSAADYPSVVRPFLPQFSISSGDSKKKEQPRISLINHDGWLHDYAAKTKAVPEEYPKLFYYTSAGAVYNKSVNLDPMHLSLIPHYPDAMLSRYIPKFTSGNDADDCDWVEYGIRFIAENKVRIHHAGWILVGACLLFEKKHIRALGAEYIKFAIEENFLKKEYLSEIIGQMIAEKYGPVVRLMEYIDRRGSSKEEKSLHLEILKNCIQSFKGKELPVNFKKIESAYEELSD
ncbi:MAG TPA: DUF6493 family protein [Leptospiraceae bacterium]|nr:DUF6493 family protein [Leptospiraceae bacterium]